MCIDLLAPMKGKGSNNCWDGGGGVVRIPWGKIYYKVRSDICRVSGVSYVMEPQTLVNVVCYVNLIHIVRNNLIFPVNLIII